MNNFLFIDWAPPIGINLGIIEIRYYSLMFALAFYLGYRIMLYIYKNEKENVSEVENLIVYLALGIIIGLRLGHVFFYDWEYFKQYPEEILLPFKFRPKFEFTGFAGLASHGGFIGGILACLFYCKKYKKNFLWALDRIMIGVSLGGALVRIGNLINSEIIGKKTDLFFGFIFKNLKNEQGSIPRHPSQLYESISYFIIAFILWNLYKKGKGIYRGYISGIAMIAIFGVRFLIEFTKENQVEFEEGMTLNMGQILSIPIILVGIYLFYNSRKSRQMI